MKRKAELEALDKAQLVQLLLEQQHRTVAKKLRAHRPLDYAAYDCHHIALRMAYDGLAYKGMATQQPMPISSTDGESVEDALFRAVLKLNLAGSIQKEEYSRCGRTDAGVSAVGQVVALRLRGNKRGSPSEPSSVPNYAALLNKALPVDIRVLDWSIAPPGFNARFDCRWRQYRYFFARKRLDLAAMREAAGKLLGEHDFRNFCAADASKGVKGVDYSTTRNITRADIVRADSSPEEDSPTAMYQLVIRGTAFLYHQVRCIMGALFAIGQGVHPVSFVDRLLDIEACPAKPPYEMASEVGLVLDDCGYPEGVFKWQHSSSALSRERLSQHLLEQYERHAARALMAKSIV